VTKKKGKSKSSGKNSTEEVNQPQLEEESSFFLSIRGFGSKMHNALLDFARNERNVELVEQLLEQFRIGTKSDVSLKSSIVSEKETKSVSLNMPRVIESDVVKRKTLEGRVILFTGKATLSTMTRTEMMDACIQLGIHLISYA